MIGSLMEAYDAGLISKRRVTALIYEQAKATNSLIEAQARATVANAVNVERGNN